VETNSISTLIPPHNLKNFLPQVLPWLEKTIQECGYTRWTLESLVDDLYKGEYQLWAACEQGKYMFLVTELVQDLVGLSVHVVLGGGQMDDDREVIHHLGLLENWSKNIGATSIVIWGRIGWKRLLAPHGYKFESAMFRRSFTDRMN